MARMRFVFHSTILVVAVFTAASVFSQPPAGSGGTSAAGGAGAATTDGAASGGKPANPGAGTPAGAPRAAASSPTRRPGAAAAAPAAEGPAISSLESKFLANVRQVTSGLPRAGEGYFGPDNTSIVFQAYPPGYPFYQIYTQQLSDPTSLRLVSTGRGRTTCSYFSPDGQRILFASSHSDPNIDITEKLARDDAALEKAEREKGKRRAYKWDFDPHMDIYEVKLDGTSMRRLTDTSNYDAEGSYSSDGKQIVFTSLRDGNDPNLFIMDADGGNPRQLTTAPGYDGGPFFSPDNRWIIFRSDRLKKDMLQLFAISADGKTEVQLTHDLNHVEWCPYFHPSGKYIIWSGADYTTGRGSFHLFVMKLNETDGKLAAGEVVQITDSPSMDVLPSFSPDGKTLLWTSTRTPDRSSQLFAADWLFTP